jgi:hypothetical protein
MLDYLLLERLLVVPVDGHFIETTKALMITQVQKLTRSRRERD